MEIARKLDDYEKEIALASRRITMGAIQIGMALDGIRSGNHWVVTGAKSFEKYAAGTFGYSKSTIYNFLDVTGKFRQSLVDNPDLQGVSVTRLIRVSPYTTLQNAEDHLHAAATIPDARGFDNYIRNLAGKVATDDEHEHKWEPVKIEVCTICKLRRKC